ncbi:MAG: glutamine--fructose-6-phosphate transaminase (isomerizing) [Clostridiales bacterium]|nr:glutamine--fructose-6-phosphate transaminase (isomerizing) [Clostridiales bacterium]
MCGIIGYSGTGNADELIIEGLHALEYRGYDSAGMTVFTKNGLKTIKTKGRVGDLESKAKTMFLENSHCGIGHTRWATHGKPSESNAHPHGTDNIMLVHNGIIENYKEIAEELRKKGYGFASETDTEVAAKLIDLKLKETGEKLSAIREAVKILQGSYAFGIVFRDETDVVYAVKKDSPLLIGIGSDGNFIASDVSAFLKYTKSYIRLGDGETAVIKQDKTEVFDLDGNSVEKQVETALWNSSAVSKSGFRHFMLKEIFEEPEILIKTLDSITKDFHPDFSATIPDDKFFENIGTIHIIACGTAMHAGLLGKYYIEKFARIPVAVEVASEFRYNDPVLRENDMVVIISQSGETADSLAALRLVNEKNIRTLSIVNTYGSTIARESKHVIYTLAGPEIAVASTKAFSVQVLVMLILAMKLGEIQGEMTKDESTELCESLKEVAANSIHNVLCGTETIESAAEITAKHNDVFFIGRGIDNYLGMEASLKLKEISYIHSEAYAAGELKHGTISLIEEGTPVIAIATDEKYYEKMRNNIEEVRSRGAFVISFCSENAEIIKNSSNIAITIPNDADCLKPLTAAASIQLFAYYTALALGRDIDKPRNLAKSVTVE